MKMVTRGFIMLSLLGLLFALPLSGYGADLSIGNTITGTGDMSLTGAMTATSFSGSGSGLTGISGANITALTIPAGAIAAGAVTSGKVAANAILPVNIAFLGNVAIVAPSGGDYTDPQAAMSASGTWCPVTPCLLKIMPGVYTVTSQVIMQSGIDIEGSGEKVTTITAALSSASLPPTTSATVRGADNAELRSLTVENTGTGIVTAAILTYGSPSLIHVTATASGGTNNYGVYSSSMFSRPTMTNVTATAWGGTNYNYGVYNNSCTPLMTNVTALASGGTNGNVGVSNSSASPTMTNVTATASGGSSNNYGVYNSSSSPTMTNVTATASGGTNYNYGVNNSSSTPKMTNVTATGSGGTYSYGVLNTTSGTVKINHSVIKGATNTIFNPLGVTTLVGNTQLDGGPVYNAGTLTCVGAYNGSYAALGTACN